MESILITKLAMPIPSDKSHFLFSFFFFIFLIFKTKLIIYFGFTGSLLLLADFLHLLCTGFTLRWLLLLWSTGSGPTASAVAALWSQQLRLGSWALELQVQ